MQTERCFSCGGFYTPIDGPTHAYMASSPGCWAAYGEWLAREYQDPALFQTAHRFTVDAYALQHPGDAADRRAVQSVWLHAASLFVIFERGWSPAAATDLLKRLAGRDFPPPDAPARAFAMTVADGLARPVSEHAGFARNWAQESLSAWSALHSDLAALTN